MVLGSHQGAEFTRQRHPSLAASMSPGDLELEGLIDGDTVEIESAHGRLITLVKADAALRPGTVSVPHMWGAQDAGARLPGEPFSGQLVSLDVGTQSVNRMPVQTGLPVRVVRWTLAAKQA